MKVQFNDLRTLHLKHEEEIRNALSDVIDNSAFVLSKYVEDFEKKFATKLGVKHCIGVGNGTDALVVVLKMLGIGQGDEVITAANSFIATAEAINIVGAQPVFVDHDKYFTINADQIEKKITSKTKAIIPVHLYGQAADIIPIRKICDHYKLFLVEDCAQSHFSLCHGSHTGTFGDAGTFSFYPGKNLGALGDGGCIVSNNDELAEKIRMYCNHGSSEKYKHLFVGCNTRLDGIQAVVLSVKLKYIDEWNKMRELVASNYDKVLQFCPGVDIPMRKEFSNHIFHLYVIKAKNRDSLKDYLSEKGIQTGLHYPTALPFLPCYKSLGLTPDDFPESFSNQSKILSLPIFPYMAEDQTMYVANCINEFYE
jgi:dTDP-4-amino-4,6-dideoxygalactose transaminase